MGLEPIYGPQGPGYGSGSRQEPVYELRGPGYGSGSRGRLWLARATLACAGDLGLTLRLLVE